MASDEEIQERQIALAEILDSFKEDKLRYTVDGLKKELHERGFTVEKRTVLRDLKEIRKRDSFVLRIATEEYSAMVHDCFKTWGEIEADLVEWKNRDWRANKTVTKQVPREDGIIEVTEETETEELAAPKIAATKLLADIQKMKLEALSGKLLDEASALMLKEYQKLKKEKEVLEEQMQAMKAKVR